MGHLSYKPFGLSIALVACGAGAQDIDRAYNRDTQQEFTLKGVTSKSLVKGPIVKQETVYDFENPYEKLTEASVWIDFNKAAVLSEFGYWFKNEFVPGILMDKNKAWFIYTAITSRNEDPGIMVQTSPSSYHTQIYPLAKGYDFRLKLTSVGFLQPSDGDLKVPEPRFKGQAYPQEVLSAKPETIQSISDGPNGTAQTALIKYPQDPNMDLQVYAQKHRDGYTYVAGLIRTDEPNAPLKLAGIHKVFWSRPSNAKDGSVKYFIGRRKGSGTVQIARSDTSNASYVKTKFIKANESGSDAAKLWAHQKLIQDNWRSNKDVLAFSLRYQVPSYATALLAVPQEQMKLFRQKAAEYRKQQAEEARRQRAWQRDRRTNWSTSSGGDPEIRVYEPDAVRAFAVLPDGRSFNLKKDRNGYWGGNYDIPADAPEGTYNVRVVTVDQAGNETTKDLPYEVDRTAPKGTMKMEDGFLVVRSEAKLAKVIVVFGDGKEETMIEVSPGLYKFPVGARRVIKVELIDSAHNITELPWSI